MRSISVDHLEEQAIDCAINQKWEEAVTHNFEIIEQSPENIQAYLRVAYAYMQLDMLVDARKMYEQVLKITPKHPIAIEQLKRIQTRSSNAGKKNKDGKVTNILDPNLFLEVPGKTRAVQLVQMGNKNDLSDLLTGQKVELKAKKKHVEIRTDDGIYLGALPDDISRRLISFIETGCVYEAYIKGLDIPHSVTVFIREMHKSKAMAHTKSFPDTIVPYSPHTDEGYDPNNSAGRDTDEEEDGDDDIEELKINEPEEHHGVTIEDDEDEEEEE